MTNDLLKFAACEGMPEDELAQLATAMERRQIPSGARLFEEGDASDSIYFIHAGTIGIRMRRDGREELLASLPANAVFGEMGAVLAQPRSAAAVAEGDVDVSLLPSVTITQWLARREPVAVTLLLNFLRIMAARIRAVNAKLIELSGSDRLQSNVRAELTEFRQKLFTTWSF